MFKTLEDLTEVELLKPFLKELFGQKPDKVLLLLLSVVSYMVIALLIIYLSFAIFRSFFSQVRFGGGITILIYLVLNYLIQKFIFPYIGLRFEGRRLVGETYFETLIRPLLTNFAFIVCLFLLIGYLFEKKVNFD